MNGVRGGQGGLRKLVKAGERGQVIELRPGRTGHSAGGEL